ncbi:MAG TPA: pentapeptide repeat-containing protein, partial [Desulfosporosinus sp.]|nr:pentapeptide repeat-containing protein [Desulfosporosinus sp.]
MEDKNLRLKIVPPELPKELERLSLDKMIQPEDSFTCGIISNCLIENQIAEHASFKQMIFKNVTFIEVSFKYLDLTDVRFENCDLSNMDLSESVLHRVE